MSKSTQPTEQTVPNPGSPEAVTRGCTCPVLDNHHRRGIPWPREDGKDPKELPSFWINGECLLHGQGDDDGPTG